MPSLRKPKPPTDPQSNVVRGPWDQPAKSPPRARPAPPRRKVRGEPMVQNWGRLALILLLLFALPPVATWLVHRLAGLMTGAG